MDSDGNVTFLFKFLLGKPIVRGHVNIFRPFNPGTNVYRGSAKFSDIHVSLLQSVSLVLNTELLDFLEFQEQFT